MFLKAILIELFVISPIAISFLIPPCEESFLLSPCTWTLGGLIIYAIVIFYVIGAILMIRLFRKPKLYRSFIAIFLSNLTLITLLLTLDEYIILAIIYIPTHFFYYWLFNNILPKFSKAE